MGDGVENEARSRMRSLITTAFSGMPIVLAVATMGHATPSRTPTPILRTVTVGFYPSAFAIDPHTARVFVTAFSDGVVNTLDARTGVLIGATPVSRRPVSAAVDPATGRVFIATQGETYNRGNGTVDVLDARTGLRLSTTVVGSLGPDFDNLALDERTARVFIADYGSDTVNMLDARTGMRLRTIHTGRNPKAITADRRLGRVVVSNQGDGSVSILDAHDGTVLHTVHVGDAPDAVVLDEDDGLACVVSRTDGAITTITVVDVRRGVVARRVRVGTAGLYVGVGVPKTHHAFFTNFDGDTVSMLDPRSGNLRAIRVGLQPYGIAVDARRNRVYVANENSNSVTVIDARNGRVRRTLRLAVQPSVVAVEDATGAIFVGSSGTDGAPSKRPLPPSVTTIDGTRL